MRRITQAALLALIAPSAPALAGSFTPPAGCQVYVTVQGKSCKVSHHYTCQQDKPGDQWRIDYNQDQAYFVSRIDRETQWVHSLDLIYGLQQQLAPGAADPASFSGLLETGADTFDFSQLSSDGQRNRIRGFDALTGRKVVIDDIELEETNFEFRETTADGRALSTARGKEYIHRKWRIFLSGPSEWDSGAGFEPYDASPMRFDFPGDKGYLSTKPEFGCDAQVAALSLPQGALQ